MVANPRRRRRRHADIDHHDLRIDRRIVGNVRRVPEQQLQRMPAPRQGDGRFGLAGAEMQVVFVVRNRLIQGRQPRVDKQMVMSGIRLVHAGRRNAHLFEAEANGERGRHVRAVVRRHDVDARACRRGMAGSWRRGLRRRRRARARIPRPSHESCRNRSAACGECGRRRRAAVAAYAVRATARVQFPSGPRRSGDGSRRWGSACRAAAGPCRPGDDDDPSWASWCPPARRPCHAGRNGSSFLAR